MSYRRLKHFTNSYKIYIKMSPKPDLEQIILCLVPDFVFIYPKYEAKGHTIENSVKTIEKKIKTKEIHKALLVYLDLHISHYTKIYFDVYSFIVALNAKFGLAPSSVRLASDASNEDDEPLVTLAPSAPKAEPNAQPQPQPQLQLQLQPHPQPQPQLTAVEEALAILKNKSTPTSKPKSSFFVY